MSLITNIKKRGLKDALNPKKWKIFARYFFFRALKKEYPELSVPEFIEQATYRMSHPGCRECVLKGECVHCGCKSPDLFIDKDNWCSGEHWYEMQPPHLWEEFKKMNDIVIDPFYLEQVKKQGIITKWRN